MGTGIPKGVFYQTGMTNDHPDLTTKRKLPRLPVLTVPALIALTVVTGIVFTIGWFWFGWQDISQNRLILRSLPVPPGTERTNVSSYGYDTDDSMLTPPSSWNTLAEYKFSDYKREDLEDYYISRLSGEWQHCSREFSEGVWFEKGNVLIGLDTEGAASANGPGSFEIHISQSYPSKKCSR